jgi:hypothetical protein
MPIYDEFIFKYGTASSFFFFAFLFIRRSPFLNSMNFYLPFISMQGFNEEVEYMLQERVYLNDNKYMGDDYIMKYDR